MPAETNFKIFNEANDVSTTFNDSEYQNATQRLTGVTPGMALSRMHNKMFRQWSVMCKAIADMMVAKGYSAMDYNEQQIAEDLQTIIDAAASDLGYLLRKNSTVYAVGDIAFSASLPSYLVLEGTTAGTTAATEPDFSGATEGDTVTDGTVVWTYRNILYAQDLANRLTREQTPAFNHRDVITTSGTYTAPVTGWYHITVKGGGGGGAGGNSGSPHTGGGGGEGGTTIAFEHMEIGDTAAVVIGAGGTGGAVNNEGTDGGSSTVTVNSNTYTGGGGGGSGTTPSSSGKRTGGAGGTGTIPGAPGGSGSRMPTNAYTCPGGAGGGNGGGVALDVANSQNGTRGGGGGGGGVSGNGYAGGNGGDGYAWFEYFAEV